MVMDCGLGKLLSKYLVLHLGALSKAKTVQDMVEKGFSKN